MLTLLSSEDSRRLRAFFEEAGYNETTLRKQLGAAELPSRQLRNQARLLDRTSAPTPLNVLLRWFWLALPQDHASVGELIPAGILSLLLESGLLSREGDSLISQAMLLHIDGFLVASDHASAIDNKDVEMVLWPNPTSKFLARFAVQRRSRATLDLGTGSGILSLNAARFSDVVVATDLNQRAVSCARFNSRLNDVTNIEVTGGDCFAPVAGRRFDLILSNPPFFITPKGDYLFCENPMELDGLCRRLIKEGPEYLHEGGYMQMLCEWAQIKRQPWEERITEWLEGIGCDAWVMKGLTQDPEEYAQHRICEKSQDPSQDAASYAGYMQYYRHRGVEAIHDGVIVIRRREGHNWIRIEEMPKTLKGDLGEMIVSTFAAHDLMQQNSGDDQVLALRPKLSPHVRLEQVCEQHESQWHAEALTLRLNHGFQFQVNVQPLVAEFLVTCDGTRTVGEAIQGLAANANAPVEKVQVECLSMIRKLIERGFMIAV
jgi:methylase of polypeptide subunit release factors